MKEEMSPFFSAVAELAGSRGFEVAGVKGGALNRRWKCLSENFINIWNPAQYK